MEVASSAVSIASLGIQVCQGLLSYYNSWKAYKADIATACQSVDDLRQTFELLEGTLHQQGLNSARVKRVGECLILCTNGLNDLENTLKEIRTYPAPSRLQEKLRSGFQRLSFPFRESTLVKIREIVGELREHLSLALQVLQLDLSTNSYGVLAHIGADVKDTATNVRDLLTAQQAYQFHKIVDWLSPPDPWINHRSARQHHEPHTGSWFLQSDRYQGWKGGHTRHLWLYGKAGCGKTVLSSTVIEDARLYCESAANAGFAMFYFSFSDSRKQSFESLLLSLVAQLGGKGLSQTMLQREHDKPNRSLPGPAALEEILLFSISQYEDVLLVLDALDECPESKEARRNMLDGLERLSRKASNLKILATSRELRDIQDCMDSVGAGIIPISTQLVDADVRRYVANELSRDRRLGRLDGATKTLIIETFAEKADGMFRWAYCQLQELKKLKSTKQKFVQATLLSLPATLDATYERMLTSIEEMLRGEALTLLRWLAYARSPPTLGELAEATIIDPTHAGGIDFDDRGDIEDTLEILSGLVTLESAKRNDEDSDNSRDEELEVSELESIGTSIAPSTGRVGRGTKVRFAHFSVKEYLESKRILLSDAKDFYLENSKEQEFLAQSCLMYLVRYSSGNEKCRTKDDLVTFPLLQYAAKSWFYHSSLQQSERVGWDVDLLSSEANKLDWLLVHQPDRSWIDPFRKPEDVGSSVYYASAVGLELVAQKLLERGADVNAQGGLYGNALQAASQGGHEKVVSMLIERGVNVNAQGGRYGNALQAASWGGYGKVVSMLIERGADVNAQGGYYGNALLAASAGGYKKVVLILLEQGADVNAPGGHYGNALHAASQGGHEKVVSMLIERGANVNAQAPFSSTALQAASIRGHEKVVSMLIEQGADVNAQEGPYGNALQAAAAGGYKKVVSILIEQGADVNAQGGLYSNMLQAASAGGYIKRVSMLLEQGLDVNTQGGLYSNALQAASLRGSEKVILMLIERGAEVNAQGGKYGNALQAASLRGNEKVVSMLIKQGADVNAQGGEYGNALQAASFGGHEKVVEILIAEGAQKDHSLVVA